MRIIGFKQGTGGSSGVGFLKQALELTFFPELFEVRTVIGLPGHAPPTALNAGGVVMRCNITHFRFDWLPQSR